MHRKTLSEIFARSDTDEGGESKTRDGRGLWIRTYQSELFPLFTGYTARRTPAIELWTNEAWGDVPTLEAGYERKRCLPVPFPKRNRITQLPTIGGRPSSFSEPFCRFRLLKATVGQSPQEALDAGGMSDYGVSGVRQAWQADHLRSDRGILFDELSLAASLTEVMSAVNVRA
jgi:hypothetical protein